MQKLISEFREFIRRGNVIDMAVGVIIATSFGKITTSLVNDILMPFISWLFGARDMTALNLVVRPETVDAGGNVVQAAITIGFGTFLAAILDFLLVALVVFVIVKAMNRRHKDAAPPAPPAPSEEVLLLKEIRDLLKKQ
ncbi:MAG: large-conductance mechanosensitive channel protein MscL [Oscillospiraceae bacterium]|nr:large-conductance mechanosensitive channel protein MscL [Oscillospiraceae bacterium]